MPTLILASTSRYRAELLQRLHLPFDTARPDVDETPQSGEMPAKLAMRLARAKAAAIASANPQAWTIGSDQVAELDGLPLGKPGDRPHALAQLAAMSGKAIHFHTAVCVMRGHAAHTAMDLTRSASARCPPTKSNAMSMPNAPSTAQAASRAKASASACSKPSNRTTPPH
jgi:septum formation protein